MLDTSVFYAPPGTSKRLTPAQLAERVALKRQRELAYRARNPERYEELRRLRNERIKAKYACLRVNTDRETYAAIKRAAAKQNINVSELIRTYITWGLETDGED
jgi:hypothetical protein